MARIQDEIGFIRRPRVVLTGTLALAALAATGVGCGGTAAPTSPPAGGGGGAAASPPAHQDEPPAGIGGASGAGGSVAGGTVWAADSQAVEVSCSGYYSGTMRLKASAAQLTTAQLAQLAGLRTVGMSARCGADGASCQLGIEQADGSVRTFAAEQDGWCLASSQEHVSFTALKPFLDSVACPFIRPGLDLVDTVPLDARCFEAVAASATVSSFQVSVGDTSRPVRVELDDCDDPASIGRLSFTLFDTDGTTALGSSMEPAESGPEHMCALLSAVVPHAGQLTIEVSGPVPSGVTPSLRVYQ